jgi:hypothetical protein
MRAFSMKVLLALFWVVAFAPLVTKVTSQGLGESYLGLRYVDTEKDSEKPKPGFSLRKNKISQILPYAFTGYLLLAAYQSGPGWIGESSWALGGLTVGAMAAGAGAVLVAMQGASDLSSEQMFWITLPLWSIPVIAQAQTVRSHQAGHRQDRTWERFGYSTLGSATAGGMFWVFPGEKGTNWPMILVAMCLGSVVGYRMAF